MYARVLISYRMLSRAMKGRCPCANAQSEAEDERELYREENIWGGRDAGMCFRRGETTSGVEERVNTRVTNEEME